MQAMYVGIDVGGACLHCVAIDDAGRITRAWLADPADVEKLAQDVAGALVVAVDAPNSLSTRPHSDDLNPALSPKFRAGRCAEIQLNLVHRLAVPWVAPSAPPIPGWMDAGLRCFDALREARITAIEVYPYAAYRVLRGSRPPRKTTKEGIRARVEALATRGVRGSALSMWSHDGLDALVAALVARDRANDAAVKVTCGHDDSAIWLPAHQPSS